MSRLHLDIGKLHRALDDRRTLRGMSWKQVGEETDLPGSFFTRMSYGQGISADALCTLLAWIGQGHQCDFAREGEP